LKTRFEKPVVADELPDVFLRVELGAFGRQRDQGVGGGDLQAAGKMPSSLIEKKDGVPPGRDLGGDLSEIRDRTSKPGVLSPPYS
jgi:hypothetical protein